MRKQGGLFGAVMVTLLLAVTTGFARNVQELPLIEKDTPLTISDLVGIALENQAAYRKATLDEGFSRYAMRGVYGAFLPRMYSSAYYRNTRSQVPTFSGSTILGASENWSSNSTWDISLSEDIFTGGSRWYGYKKAKLQRENAELYLARSRDEITYKVKEAVYAFFAAKRSLEVAEEVVKLRQLSLQYARAKYETGDVIELDVMQAEIDLGNAKNSLILARQRLENAREGINLAIGANLDSRFPIDYDLEPVLPEVNPESLVRVALASRPDLEAMRNNVDIQKNNVRIQTAGYLPTASISAGVSASYSAAEANSFRLFPEDDTRYAGVSLSWSIFNQFRTSVNRQQAVVEKRKADWDRFQTEQNISAQIRAEWRDLTRLYDQVKVLEKNRELARRQLEFEQERYRLGASSLLNLRSAQVTFIEAENNHIATVSDFFKTMAALERDLGCPLGEVKQ